MAVLGPTASGKSDVAVAVAAAVGGEIISVDSMQVYRGMDIGTAKPSTALQTEIPHHMIDVADPEDVYTVAEFQRDGVPIVDRSAAETTSVLVGGSGLHFRAVVDPLEFPPTNQAVRAAVETDDLAELLAELLAADPDAGTHVDLGNSRRVRRAVEILRLTSATPSSRAGTPRAHMVRAYEPRIPLVAIGFDPGAAVAGRVEARFDAMLEQGLLDEVAGLADRLGPTASQAVGYKELVPVVRGKTTIDEARQAALAATMALVKRQRTYFRRDPRIRWLPWHDDPATRTAMATAALEEM